MKKFDFSKPKQRLSVTLVAAGAVFLLSLLIAGITSGVLAILVTNNLVTVNGLESENTNIDDLILYMFLICVALGIILAFLLSKTITHPINRLINAMNALAAGNYDIRINNLRGPFSKLSAVKELTKSFNTLARELESTEVLSANFVNDFSHEFKTPIVSIAGFAHLLHQGNLSERDREEYLTIIEEESMRLANMATNVLNLTKLETQTILTDLTEFNLSEQIRSCVLLLEDKWSKKDLSINLNFDEVFFTGNEELLQQVWLNLLENAIKFAPEQESVSVDIVRQNEELRINISNTGSIITSEQAGRVFQKFYQGDPSHATQGNGIGLAIVTRIVNLHEGSVEVSSNEAKGETCFTVVLPL